MKDAARFREKAIWLRDHFDVVALDALVGDDAPSDRPRVALTFDDGDASWHDVAAPILVELDLPATFFVSSGFVGLAGAAAEEFCRTRLRRTRRLHPLSRAELATLAATPGCAIGSHTRRHVDLGQPWDDAVLADEIDGDRDRLADWTGRAIRFFAWPFGGRANAAPGAVEHVARAGFTDAFTFVPGPQPDGGHPYLRPRDGLDELDDVSLWDAWLRGGYDELYDWKARLLGR